MRAVVVDDEDRVLLVRLEFPHWAGWVLPGGGVEDGEEDLAAVRRELAEELGLVDPPLVGPIWERTVLFSGAAPYDGQVERIYFLRCAPFTPAPQLSRHLLRAEGVTDMRWWRPDDLAACTETIAPSRLCALLAELAEVGPPLSIVDVSE